MAYENNENNTKLDGCMDWDDVIESDGQEFIILEEGDYVFTVTGFERGRFPGGPNTPACNKATLTLEVKTDDGVGKTRHDLILHKNMEWLLASFFRSIGQKKKGEPLKLDWNSVVGSKGRAHFAPRTYTDKNGNEKQANDVKWFYDYDPEKMPEEDFMAVADEELPFN